LSRDPGNESGGKNLYAYVGNNPINFTDPLGLCRQGFWSKYGEWIALGALGVALLVLAPELLPALLAELAEAAATAYAAAMANLAEMAAALTTSIASALPFLSSLSSETPEMENEVNESANLAEEANQALSSAGESSGDGISASTPIGSSGSPMDVERWNSAGSVNGINYSGHAFDEMQSDGVMPSVVENAIQNGTEVAGKVPGTTAYWDFANKITVIVNADGGVVTVSRGIIKQ
jgi:uncharacterized protein RhaS with RHS repeats